MINDMKRLISDLNKGWVYSKDLLVFLKGYDNFSELLRVSDTPEPAELLAHYEAHVSHKTEPNSSIIRFLLLRAAGLNGTAQHSDRFYSFVDDLVSKRCIADHDSRSVVFLAYQGAISKSDNVFAALRKEKGKGDQERRIRRKLYRVFEKFDEQNRDLFFASLISNSTEENPLFDAVCGVHHQVIDNIDHWMAYHDNPNWNAQTGSLFGDTLVFKVSRITLGNYGDSAHSTGDASLTEYMINFSKKKGVRDARFWKIEYYDNGRGIVRNLKKFGAFEEQDFNLLTALKENKSIRGSVGTDRRNGEGFSIIFDEARRLSGYVSLVSGGERVGFSPLTNNGLEYEEASSFNFGTHLSIVFPG